MERIPSQGVAAKHIITMKFSTEAIVAAAVAVVFAVLSLGAIAREQGEPGSGSRNPYVGTTTVGLSQATAGDKDLLGFY